MTDIPKHNGHAGDNQQGGKDSPERSSPLSFPCEFIVKIIMKKTEHCEQQVINMVQRHFPQFNHDQLSERPSQDNNYIAYTATLYVERQEPLDSLYQELSDTPDVLMAL